MLSADAYAAFEEAGLDQENEVRATGARFRDTVLSLGGSRAPAEVFKAFRGRERTSFEKLGPEIWKQRRFIQNLRKIATSL